ncbi:MFS family permease [Actinoplanes lutulentus]|uniref:Na+/melibiose symporter-like transporter n=1 Tax=Actinoplanes lutulentus TaxID=1287878 RepID=A0A327YY55_9ACTN|nr:MFS transporter [Actinoplanes lutulentus]MBB2946522.1 MFS family permease [Actinoplanes lutulentus]RAK26440.1 Na+/melibiose symporter-like transporter [Actinoplanes lutulentus]
MALLPAGPTPDLPIDKVRPPVGARYVWLNIAAMFGVYLAFVTPIALSLAIKVGQLAPGREEYLGYIIGVGSLAAIIANPIVGTLSDRLRSRFGQRRPFLLLGTAIGLIALVVIVQSSSVLVLGLGWMLAQAGWAPVITLLLTSQADQLPEEQRGRVAGLGGVVTQMAPVVGVLLVGGFAGNSLLLFLVPGIVGALAVLSFVLFVPEADNRDVPRSDVPLSAGSLLRTYTFSPRRHPDFAWNWLGKFLVMFGITLNTTFTAFFLADRLDVSVEEVAGTVAIMGIGGIATGMAGAIGGGFLSDRLKRRRIFVLVGTAIFAGGAVLLAFAPSMPLIIVASLIGTLGLGAFSSVDQALTLDVLPDRDTDAGRYMGVFAFATTSAQGIAPFIAPAFLAIGASGGDKNYTLLYLVAAVVTLAGGLTIATRIKNVR